MTIFYKKKSIDILYTLKIILEIKFSQHIFQFLLNPIPYRP